MGRIAGTLLPRITGHTRLQSHPHPPRLHSLTLLPLLNLFILLLLPVFSCSSCCISVVSLLSALQLQGNIVRTFTPLAQPQSERCVSTIETRSIVATRSVVR